MPGPQDDGTVTREGDVVSGTGTVKHFDLEGGFFAIVGDDQKTYDPTNLAESFRVNGLRVRFRARLRNDVMSIRMVGQPVELLEITRLS